MFSWRLSRVRYRTISSRDPQGNLTSTWNLQLPTLHVPSLGGTRTRYFRYGLRYHGIPSCRRAGVCPPALAGPHSLSHAVPHCDSLYSDSAVRARIIHFHPARFTRLQPPFATIDLTPSQRRLHNRFSPTSPSYPGPSHTTLRSVRPSSSTPGPPPPPAASSAPILSASPALSPGPTPPTFTPPRPPRPIAYLIGTTARSLLCLPTRDVWPALAGLLRPPHSNCFRPPV